MTTNQINYQNAMERIRNDREIEMETRRHNQAVEDYNRGLLSNQEFSNREVKRHNQVMETLQQRANEIQAWKASIDARYNELNIELGNRRAAEEERRNRQNEILTQQSQNIQEWINQKTTEINTRKLEYAHQEALLDIGIRDRAQVATQEHYERQDYTQRISAVGSLSVSAFNAFFGATSSLLLKGVG